jgi:DUF3095 family protein
VDTFFHDMPAMQNLSQITQLENYLDVPDDWYVALTDVMNSTQAIEEGRYKSVNTVAAVTITAVLNSIPDVDVPFVFGGDGASIVIPVAIKDKVKEALAAIKWMGKENFGFEVRAGLVPVRDVTQAGYKIKVGKLGISENFQQPVFTGEGLDFADRLLKSADGERYQIEADPNAHADFSGYECRWSKHPASSEEVLSLLVKVIISSADKRHQIYDQIIHEIHKIYGEFEERHPISLERMSVATIPQSYYNELAWKQDKVNWRNLLSLMFWSIGGFLLWKYVHKIWNHYRQTVHATTDHEKFDDALRMTISGTAKQRQQLRDYLDIYQQLGQVAFGMHTAKHSLMTCIVFDRFGRQVHFLDADEGGYAMAAKEMKAQLAAYSQATVANA